MLGNNPYQPSYISLEMQQTFSVYDYLDTSNVDLPFTIADVITDFSKVVKSHLGPISARL